MYYTCYLTTKQKIFMIMKTFTKSILYCIALGLSMPAYGNNTDTNRSITDAEPNIRRALIGLLAAVSFCVFIKAKMQEQREKADLARMQANIERMRQEREARERAEQVDLAERKRRLQAEQVRQQEMKRTIEEREQRDKEFREQQEREREDRRQVAAERRRVQEAEERERNLEEEFRRQKQQQAEEKERQKAEQAAKEKEQFNYARMFGSLYEDKARTESNDEIDPYEALGVSKHANSFGVLGLKSSSPIKTVKAKWHELSRKWHPDKHKEGTKEYLTAAEVIKIINRAKDECEATISGLSGAAQELERQRQRAQVKVQREQQFQFYFENLRRQARADGF